ncbi:MAG: 5'/3'-nucleotidase SurE, partial [Anaerolineae bacterium]
LEAAAHGVPALAVSRETPIEYHNSYSDQVDFGVAAHFARLFARQALQNLPFPPDVDVLKIDIPATATPDTAWRFTRVSRQSYHYGIPAAPEKRGIAVEGGYVTAIDKTVLEPDSDIWAIAVDQVISVSPLSFNLTSRVDFSTLQERLNGHRP